MGGILTPINSEDVGAKPLKITVSNFPIKLPFIQKEQKKVNSQAFRGQRLGESLLPTAHITEGDKGAKV